MRPSQTKLLFKSSSNNYLLSFINGMDRKFKESSCLKTPANSGLVTQVYRNSMSLFTRYAQSRQQFEIKLMSDIENSLIGALNNLNREKVSFLVIHSRFVLIGLKLRLSNDCDAVLLSNS